MCYSIYNLITRRAQPYQTGSNRCNSGLEEKVPILQANPVNTFNQGTKLVSKCPHKAKYKQEIISLMKPRLMQID